MKPLVWLSSSHDVIRWFPEEAHREAEVTMKMTRTHGNVFADLGFNKETAENLRIRADLMIELRHVIQHKALTQAQAAKFFGVSQPRVSDLVRGKIALFTIDMLVNMLARAGKKVVLQTKRKKAA